MDGAFVSTDRALAMTRGQWMGDSRVLGHLFRPRETLTSRQWAHALTICVFALCSRCRGHPKCRSAVSINQIFDGEIGTSLAWNRFDSLGRPRRQALSGGHAIPAVPSGKRPPIAWAHTRRRPIEPRSFPKKNFTTNVTSRRSGGERPGLMVGITGAHGTTRLRTGRDRQAAS